MAGFAGVAFLLVYPDNQPYLIVGGLRVWSTMRGWMDEDLGSGSDIYIADLTYSSVARRVRRATICPLTKCVTVEKLFL